MDLGASPISLVSHEEHITLFQYFFFLQDFFSLQSSHIFHLLYVTNNHSRQVSQVVKNPPANEGAARDARLIPELGRSPGGGNGNPLQYSCVGNAIDRGAWQIIVYGVAKSWIQLKQMSMHQ